MKSPFFVSAPFLALVGFLERLVGVIEVQTPTEVSGGRVFAPDFQ
jgi:hypothetical protein